MTTNNIKCLQSEISVSIVDLTGNKYVFGENGYQTPYSLNIGEYTLKNVPLIHAIFLEGNDPEKIQMSGTQSVSGQFGSGFFGDVTITVTQDFGTVSYVCVNHGYMGGQNNLTFDGSCVVEASETPTSMVITENTPTPVNIITQKETVKMKKISSLDEISNINDSDEFVVIDKSVTIGDDASETGKSSKVTFGKLKEFIGSQGQKGEIGITGEKGKDGLTGNDGSKGQKGEIGIPRVSGEKGDKGKDGSDGSAGPSGSDGIKGSKGEPSFIKGDKGEPSRIKGDKGEPSRIKGDKGEPSRIKGDKGEPSRIKGDKGEPSRIKGDKGEPSRIKGDKGEPSRIKGDKGEPSRIKGDKGEPSRIKGDKGEPSRIKGDKGDQGKQGDNGDVGNPNRYLKWHKHKTLGIGSKKNQNAQLIWENDTGKGSKNDGYDTGYGYIEPVAGLSMSVNI